MARVTAQKRKLQRDVDEQTEQAESTQRELDQLRSKLRTGDKARSVCGRTTHARTGKVRGNAVPGPLIIAGDRSQAPHSR